MDTYKVDNGTQTKTMTVEADSKRFGLLIARYFDANGKQIDTTYGKKNQQEIQSEIKESEKI